MNPKNFVRRIIFWAALVAVGTRISPLPASEHLTVWVGTYTGKDSKGIYAFDLDTASGAAGPAQLVAETANPSFLALHPNGRFLYAVNETSRFKDEDGGGISAFALQSGPALTPLNQQSTRGDSPCHVFIDEEGRNALVANYGGGSVISYPLESDGRLGASGSFVQHRGSSVNPQRQTGPHAHGIYLNDENTLALVPDLGLDRVMIYRFEPASGKLSPANPAFAPVKPGSGPRHLAVHPDGGFVFVLNEMASTITTFAFDGNSGTMKELTTVSTLPSSHTGEGSTAEIFVHPNGRFVYSSNRGHDSIAMFSLDASTGELTPMGHQSTGGRTPRNFNIDPEGRWLLAANQDSGTVSVFKIDTSSGKLEPTGTQVDVPSPVCLVFSTAP